jgi:hypothetical protein
MRRRIDGPVVLGAILVLLGALFLVGQLVPVSFDLGHYGWPVFVILPGLAFLAFGLLLEGASGLVIPGCIITVTGIVLAVQNTFDLFATMAYTWALIAPGGVGLGIALQGVMRHSPEETRAGLRVATIGLVLFLVFGAFFEGMLHISGRDLGIVGKLGVPLLLIGAGIWLVVGRARTPLPPPAGEVGRGAEPPLSGADS